MSVHRHLVEVVAALPVGLLLPALGRLLRGRRAALCLHRVYDTRRSGDAVPRMSHTPDQLDEVLSLLLRARPASDPPWLTLTFDDGYAGAADYVDSRAPRYPGVEWLFFVCPEKTEKQVGFRWDLYEWRRHRKIEGPAFDQLMAERLDVEAENSREDLRQAALEPEFRLATVEQVKRLERHPNVSIGNHTNTHFKPTTIGDEAFGRDVDLSNATFERLFGPCRHFAFPFGHPDLEFTEGHVRQARQPGRAVLWSTEAGTYVPGARNPGAVLPRFPVNGRLSPRQIVAWMFLVVLRQQLAPRTRWSSDLSPDAA